ncbi:7817_t:CDS:1 [Racocetra fulgida]|uniref:7817_t:CDS:1 n=1 Tax=Racocetra fulgida TaxID=60492 RepID=A0A9N9A2C9_9GLOM|nr:7817_t:CDS:1 [Racocetra fulgida]
MSKITKQEFENYNKQLFSIFARMMATSEFQNASKEEQERCEKFFGLLLDQIQSGNIFALCASCKMAEDVLNEDVSTIKRRAKEHIIARGYYNPASPLTLAEFRERKKKLGYEKFGKL